MTRPPQKGARSSRPLYLCLILISISSTLASASSPTDLEAGRQAYETNCARCHGPTGAGDGFDAKRMLPKPRHLAEGIFKFRTTASGTPPTDRDLFRTISSGLPGSRMPDFQRLPEETRWNLVAYVKSLSPVFQDQKPEPVDLGTDPGVQGMNLARGKELYAQLGCASCHGNLGRANGPSAPTLVDNWGEPTKPANLTQGWNYRAGAIPRDIVARILTGIDGSPMPSYAEATPTEEVWHLAYYLQSLQEKPNFRRAVETIRVTGALPVSLDDPQWQQIPSTHLRLSSSLYQQGEILPTTVTALSVQAVYNERELCFRLSWHDPSESRNVPADAIGLLLIPDRRLKYQIGSVRSWPAATDAPALDFLHWSANRNAAQEAVTRGAAPMASGQATGIPLESQAAYGDGEWVILIRRPLDSEGEGFAKIGTQKSVLLGVMIWDGDNGEQDRRRASSNWVDFKIRDGSP